jgi:putative hemolysin
MIASALERLFGLHGLDAAYRSAERKLPDRSIYGALTQVLRLRSTYEANELHRVPASGPAIVVANHPTGAADGLVLAGALERVRKDVKILSHVWFGRYPALADRMFLVDPKAKGKQAESNARAIRAAADWLADGHVLIVFPAGSVARFRWSEKRITDPPWHSGVARLLHETSATVLPAYLEGRNGALYYLLSMIHPRLGVLVLAHELLAMRRRTVRIRIGRPIPYETFKSKRNAKGIVEALRRTTYRLEEATGRDGARCLAGTELASGLTD